MKTLWGFVLLVFVVSAAHGLYTDQGHLHKALANAMANRPHLRKINVTEPRLSRWSCTWTMTAWVLGEYGEVLTLVYVKTDNCSKYTKDSWAESFPCVLTRNSLTTCQGPLPAGAEDEEWGIYDDDSMDRPIPWSGILPSAPKRLLGGSRPFDRTLNCDSLVGLTVARAVQHTGMYIGNGTVACQRAKDSYYLQVDNHELHFWLRVYIDATLDTGIITKNVTWVAGFDSRDRFVVSTEGRVVRYTKNMLSGYRVKFHGKRRTIVNYDNYKLEPRLCPLSSMHGACSVMRSLSEIELETLGNVTGFNLAFWRPVDATVSMRGYVLGTKGVLEALYSASVVDKKDPEWMELPLSLTSSCNSRLYSFSDCSALPAGAPRLGPYKPGHVIHHVFP